MTKYFKHFLSFIKIFRVIKKTKKMIKKGIYLHYKTNKHLEMLFMYF